MLLRWPSRPRSIHCAYQALIATTLNPGRWVLFTKPKNAWFFRSIAIEDRSIAPYIWPSGTGALHSSLFGPPPLPLQPRPEPLLGPDLQNLQNLFRARVSVMASLVEYQNHVKYAFRMMKEMENFN